MRDITLEELLTSGAHFGHQVNRRNPKADEYIFEARAGVNIIDLGKTREGLLAAGKYIKALAARGGTLVVVGTKKQAAEMVETEAERARKESGDGIYYITSRWIGGILTNFSEVSRNFKKLDDIEKIITSNSSEYTKREKLLMEREKQKLLTLYRGVASLKGTPDAMFIVDTHLEKTAVNEGLRSGVTLVGITDTNADPSVINYPIPANDDAAGSLKLIITFIIDAWIEGKKQGVTDREAAKVQSDKDAEKAEKNSESKVQSSEKKTEKTEKEPKKVAKKSTKEQVPSFK